MTLSVTRSSALVPLYNDLDIEKICHYLLRKEKQSTKKGMCFLSKDYEEGHISKIRVTVLLTVPCSALPGYPPHPNIYTHNSIW